MYYTKAVPRIRYEYKIERIFHSHNIPYTAHCENRIESVYICQFPHQYFYSISVCLRYTGILLVCWFASINFFAQYQYRYDKNTVLLDLNFTLASANTFSPSSQPMLVSKGSMLSSKGNMLSCMILLAIEVDTCMQLVARIRHRAISRCTRARLHPLVHYFTCDLSLMLAYITRQAFIKCLLAILIHEQ